MPSNAEIDWADCDATSRFISLHSKNHLKQKFNYLRINRTLVQQNSYSCIHPLLYKCPILLQLSICLICYIFHLNHCHMLQ